VVSVSCLRFLALVRFFKRDPQETRLAKPSENWVKKEKRGLGRSARDAVRGPQPIKPQVQKATRELSQEIGKLENTSSRLKQKENAIFKRTVSAVQSHNEQTGRAYANELAEVRKMQRMVSQSKMALEQVSTRLDTVVDIGDFTASLAPTIEVVKRLCAAVCKRAGRAIRR
jgi:division protein CdvB (Snf7/Vps24/ESCRT-III family)